MLELAPKNFSMLPACVRVGHVGRVARRVRDVEELARDGEAPPSASPTRTRTRTGGAASIIAKQG